jgi:hypothetical protein
MEEERDRFLTFSEVRGWEGVPGGGAESVGKGDEDRGKTA